MSQKTPDEKSAIILQASEIESLNVDDLNIEELERRIEMASLIIAPDDCGSNCGTNCGTNCGSFG